MVKLNVSGGRNFWFINMSIDEEYTNLGIVHLPKCPICKDLK